MIFLAEDDAIDALLQHAVGGDGAAGISAVAHRGRLSTHTHTHTHAAESRRHTLFRFNVCKLDLRVKTHTCGRRPTLFKFTVRKFDLCDSFVQQLERMPKTES